MAHVPEGRRVFANLTVLQNLKMGAYTRKDKNEIEQTLETVYTRFPRLKERQNQMAGTLSGGEQQMLAMGRALMSHPKIILMDEPSMGLSPIFAFCSSRVSVPVEQQYFWWNRMPGKHFPLLTGHMYWKQEMSYWKEKQMSFCIMMQSRKHI